MINWERTQQAIISDLKVNNHPERIQYTQIQNYYGAHKNFKTDFRNKKYKHVYTQLIHRKPAQEQHMALYFQDVLISIIKTLDVSLLGKEVHIGPIQPFFHFGTKAIKQFYWLFLMEKRIINKQLEIDPAMKNKISNFLTLIVDFCCKIGQYMSQNGNLVNSRKICQSCYHNIVKCIISSSTSNILLLKKCGQFLLQYAKQCVKAGNNQQAKIVIKDGLIVQLNQLILLKYESKKRNKQKKCLKRYLSALKTLSHFYLNLALLYEKKNKAFQCATVILDAVLIQQLISSYKTKAKKWICNLQQSYAEQKNKYLQVTRICNYFFKEEFLEQLKIRYQSLAQSQCWMDNVHPNLNMARPEQKRNNYYFMYGNESYSQIDSQYTLNNELSKKKKEKSYKQVRFKLVNDDIIESKQNKQILSISQSEDCIKINRNKHRNGTIKRPHNFNEKTKQDQIKKLEQLKTARKLKQKSKSLLSRKIDNVESNDFLFFGESFQQTTNTIRSKSLNIKSKDSNKYDSQNSGKRDNFDTASYLEIEKQRHKLTANHIRSKTYLKSNFMQTGLKKKSNKKKLFVCDLDKPQNYEKVNRKFQDFYKKYSKIETDMILKVDKLKQRKQIKNGQQIIHFPEQSPQYSGKRQDPTIKKKGNQQKLQIKEDFMSKKSRKVAGINLLKQFIMQNKNFFGITKPQIFNTNVDLQGPKRYLSFLTAQKPQNMQKFIEKNHWQAKNNISHFIKQIQDSNKKLKKQKRRHRSNCNVSQSRNRVCKQFYQDQKLLNLDNRPLNLFGTSLKQRARQVQTTMNFIPI